MRLRPLAAWVLLPPLAGVLLACWFVGRSVTEERTSLADVGSLAVSGDTVNEANAWVAGEITNLMALDGFAYEHPELSDYSAAAVAAEGAMTRTQIVDYLQSSDSEGARLLDQLGVLGDAPDAIATVLAPLDPATVDALAAGERAVVDPQPYADASHWLMDQYDAVRTRSADATVEVAALRDQSSYWRDREFLGFALALALLAVTGGVIALWRVSHAGRDTALRLSRSEAQSAQLRRIIASARRFTAESDFPSLSRTLMSETRELLGGELASLVRRNGGRLEPVVVNGDLRVAGVATGDGAVGRCADTGAVTRAIVPADPFLPGVPGPIAMLAAPLVADSHVIGALVVASRGTTMFDDNDEAALQLLALLAAGAVTAAQRYDTTVALALRDPLTGLANRRRLDHDLTTSALGEPQVAFLMIDIDHFKAFNDHHGHQRGDDLLRLVGAAISAAVRDGDVVYRYGGEEFSVLLPGTDAPTAAAVGERVRTSVLTATASSVQPVTVSVGVAAQVAPVHPADLVARADAALYRAKQTGRDRVSLA
jgi:diguanylate cyclase (GGDEF)-like protein